MRSLLDKSEVNNSALFFLTQYHVFRFIVITSHFLCSKSVRINSFILEKGKRDKRWLVPRNQFVLSKQSSLLTVCSARSFRLMQSFTCKLVRSQTQALDIRRLNSLAVVVKLSLRRRSALLYYQTRTSVRCLCWRRYLSYSENNLSLQTRSAGEGQRGRVGGAHAQF